MTLKLSDNNLKKLASMASVLLAILLAVIKFIAYLKTDSLAILSSLVDSVTDLIASLITFVAVYFSTKPADKNYRYGFGKAEALSAFMQAILVGSSGIYIIYDINGRCL